MPLRHVLTSLLALGQGKPPSSTPHYRPRKGAPTPPKPPPPSIVRLQICLSPGCTADGSMETLKKMKALAPANVIVEAGSCVSLCGSGPVVVQSKSTSDTPTKEKRVKTDDKILQILYPTGDIPKDLIKGYELVEKGDAAFAKEDHKLAVHLYEEAVNVAFRSAVVLENEREYLIKLEDQNKTSTTNRSSSRNPTTRVPEGLDWLIRARRNEASCKLKLGDVDGAMLAAQASCNLSRNTCAESFLLLAEIYRIEGALEGELQALEKTLSLWVEETSLSFAQKNQRRIASLRLQKFRFRKKIHNQAGPATAEAMEES
eukprot:scaffold1216_cov136-Amphora_coffeaeformis.AAC.5